MTGTTTSSNTSSAASAGGSVPPPESANSSGALASIQEGYVLVVKQDCPTCTLIEPLLPSLRTALDADGHSLTVFSQDDPSFPRDRVAAIDDRTLEASFRFAIETVPTLIRFESGIEVERAIGWHRDDWSRLTGTALGENLPDWQAGCGSLSVEPGMAEELVARFGDPCLASRKLDVDFPKDAMEACFDRGWSDGLPVTPPTEARVLRMLAATRRSPAEVVGLIPPSMAPCSIEKIAVNAVMAGCRPEYLPVVITAIEAALEPQFGLHGVLCTTDFVGPMVIVNGPIAKRIGMNCGVNVLGQGNRANATIGRALQLVVRNVGGGRPGEIDRSTIGQPGKFGVSYCEDEEDADWQSLAESRGIAAGKSAVTLFAAAGVQAIWDERARTARELCASIALAASAIGHPKRYGVFDANVVISPDHYRIFAESNWNRERIASEIEAATARPADQLLRGVGGNAEGMLPQQVSGNVTKFRPGGLMLTRAGGPAGLISAIISGWAASGERGSSPVTREIIE